MKKNLLLFSITLILFAISCKPAVKESTTEENSIPLSEYYFKVLRLNDSIVADSIWKMIFSVEGIEQMSILLNDSIVYIKADTTIVKVEMLEREIVNRGGIILTK